MTAYRMLYAVAVGLPILGGAYMVAATLRRSGRAERGVWAVGLILALALPAVLLTQPVSRLSLEPVTVDGEPTPTATAEPEGGETGILFPNVIVVHRADAGFGLDETLLLAWLVVSAGLAVRWLVSARRLAKLSASWSTHEVDGTRVWLTPGFGPAVTGLLRMRILVPDWLLALPERRRALVLLHEREHVRARDPLLMTLCRSARIAAPWNPVVWILSSRLLRAVEMDCDRRVLRRRPDVRTYCDTLFAISARQPSRLVGAAAFAESQIPLTERIVSMTTPPRPLTTLGSMAFLALGALLVFGSCGVPMPTDNALSARQSALEEVDPPNWVTIELSAEGRVAVDGESVAMEDVASAVADRAEAVTEPLVTRLQAPTDVPYRYLDELQREVVEGGVVRVVFRVTGGDEAGELAIVLPEPEMEMPVSQRNVLTLIVQPSGTVDVRRGASATARSMSAREVERLWRQEVAGNPKLIASVKVHRDASYDQFGEVLGALLDADAQRISIQAVNGQ